IGVVRPAADAPFAAEPAGLDQLGTDNFRSVNNRPRARLSQHAHGNAIDVAAIRLDDGRRIAINADNWRGDAVEGRFLRDLRDGACGAFRAVIGPARDAAHARHFHLDLGPYRVCR
ncbi:MAG: extensin family protein, partial [Pseudomonadota bacterium]